MKEHVTILLVDDHAMLRESLASCLRNEFDLNVVGTAENADIAVGEAVKLSPDIVLMDIDMPGRLCFDAARTIQARCPGTRIVFLSAFFHDRYIEQALAAEASGYITKSENTSVIIKAVRMIASGGSYFSPEVLARIVVDEGGTRLARKGERCRASMLTSREAEVLRYIARGLSQKEMAKLMHISPRTAHCHSVNIMTKLDIHDRVELARFAIREGLAEA